jgi:hypothetical protein
MMRFFAKFVQLAANRSGVAAIEFAFIAPVMIAGLLVVCDLGKMLLDRTNMQSAARTGMQYLMNGGRDMDAARNVVLAAWSSKPADGDVITERYCLCAEVEHACDTLCGDQSTPEFYTRISLVGTLNGLWSQHAQTADEVIRIR